jgi:hypothetical protein
MEKAPPIPPGGTGLRHLRLNRSTYVYGWRAMNEIQLQEL